MVTTRELMHSGLFCVCTTSSLAAAREVPYWYSAPKIANCFGLGMCTRVHCGHFGPTGVCRGLLGQFLWPRTYTVLYCTCMWIFPQNLEYRIPVKILSLPYFTWFCRLSVLEVSPCQKSRHLKFSQLEAYDQCLLSMSAGLSAPGKK